MTAKLCPKRARPRVIRIVATTPLINHGRISEKAMRELLRRLDMPRNKRRAMGHFRVVEA